MQIMMTKLIILLTIIRFIILSAISLIKLQNKKSYLKTQLQNVYLKDIGERSNLRSKEILDNYSKSWHQAFPF